MNIGTADRVIRLLVVGAIAIAYALGAISGVVAFALGAVGLVLLLTGLFATCPACMPFGISTRGRR